MQKKGYHWGFFFIIFGVFLLLNQVFELAFFSITKLWPLFILIPGLSMEASFAATRKNSGILIPGGILTTLGILFLFETFTNWRFAAYTWPVYLLAVAIGLFQFYLFGYRNKFLLIPILILTFISLFSFAILFFGAIFDWLNYSLLFPALFIFLGITLLFKNRRS